MITEIIVVSLIALLGSLAGAGMTAFIAWRRWPTERRASEADVTSKVVGGYSQLTDDMREEITLMHAKVGVLEKRDRAQAGDLVRLRQELLLYLKRIQGLERENISLKRDLETEREKRRTEVKRLEACINDLEAQNKALRQENAELRSFYEKGLVNGQQAAG